jgi:ribosomal peptide maturation radical SAM protein 1
MGADRVLLAQMPMGLVQVPSLALSLLKPGLIRSGLPCDVRYLNVEFVQQFLGGEDAVGSYVRLVENQALAEICAAHFTAARFGRDAARDAVIADTMRHATSEQKDLIDRIVRAVDPFLAYCLDAVDWAEYALVGFTSLFAGMTMPSVVLGGLLKERFPHLRVVLGGWNTGGPMGEVIAEKFPRELDFVLRGEADETLPKLAAAVVARQDVDTSLPGLLVSHGKGRALAPTPQALVRNLDAVPLPDFDDYFSLVRRGGRTDRRRRCVSFESSRGCWWGQVSHCKFCGLNGLSMPFRSKSPARLLAELDYLVERYDPVLLYATDTIIDTRYFNELLPTLRDRYVDVRFAYEVKAPVTREQMRVLGDACVTHITVGIESLSTRLLKVMGKGTSALQNIHCLRVADEAGVKVGWQHLIGFPSEQLEDYIDVIASMARLHHLTPPERACPVTVARFSPYFEKAEALHVGNVRPVPEYAASYPWPIEDLSRVAYHFTFEHADGRHPTLTRRISTIMERAVADWRDRHPSSRLDAYRGRSVIAILDTRGDRRMVYLLQGLVADVYRAMDTPIASASLPAYIRDQWSLPGHDWFSRLLAAVDDASDTELVAWAVERARALDTTVVRLGDYDPFIDTDTASLIIAIRHAIDQLDRADLLASEQNKYLALGVWRSRPVPTQTRPAGESAGNHDEAPASAPAADRVA